MEPIEKNGGSLAHDEQDIRYVIIRKLLCCGHSLQYRVGGKAGRNRILHLLSVKGEMPQKELQGLLDIQSGSVSETVKKLESDGLIEKWRSKEDGRNILIQLTDEGEHQAQLAQRNFQEQVERIMEDFSPEERERLDVLLTKLQAILDTK